MMVLFNARMSCRQRAVFAVLALPIGQHGTPCVQPVLCRSRDSKGPVKTEGKIKGPARSRPQSESARGLGAARRLAACVPSWNANPYGVELGRVPFSMRYVGLRWSECRGLA